MTKTSLPATLAKLSREEIRQAALFLSMTEVVNRHEPARAAPDIAAMLRARKPSEIPPRIVEALVDGLFIEAEIFARRGDIVQTITGAGSTPEEAEEFFQGQLYSRKWAAIAREAAR